MIDLDLSPPPLAQPRTASVSRSISGELIEQMEALIKFIKAAPLILSDDSHSHSFLIKTDPLEDFRKTHAHKRNQESSIDGKAAQ